MFSSDRGKRKDEGTPADDTPSRKTGTARFSFRKKIKDVVRDLESKPSPKMVGVAQEALASSRSGNELLKNVKLKKVPTSQKKAVEDIKGKRFAVPPLKSVKKRNSEANPASGQAILSDSKLTEEPASEGNSKSPVTSITRSEYLGSSKQQDPAVSKGTTNDDTDTEHEALPITSTSTTPITVPAEELGSGAHNVTLPNTDNHKTMSSESTPNALTSAEEEVSPRGQNEYTAKICARLDGEVGASDNYTGGLENTVDQLRTNQADQLQMSTVDTDQVRTNETDRDDPINDTEHCNKSEGQHPGGYEKLWGAHVREQQQKGSEGEQQNERTEGDLYEAAEREKSPETEDQGDERAINPTKLEDIFPETGLGDRFSSEPKDPLKRRISFNLDKNEIHEMSPEVSGSESESEGCGSGKLERPETGTEEIDGSMQDLPKLRCSMDQAVVSLTTDIQKGEVNGEDERQNIDLGDEIGPYKSKIKKLEKLVQAKDNSIKTFIKKNDILTSELLDLKDSVLDKDMALRTMSDSLQVVAERCNVKTKQVESQEEQNQETHIKNSALHTEVDVLRRKVGDLESEVLDYQRLNNENKCAFQAQKQALRRREEEILQIKREAENKIERQVENADSSLRRADRYSDELGDLRDQLVKLREKTEKEKRVMFDEIQIMEADRSDLSAKYSFAENHLKKSNEEKHSISMNTARIQNDYLALQSEISSVRKEQIVLREELTSAESMIGSLNVDNKLLRKEVDDLKIEQDTSTQQKVSLTNRVGLLQKDLEEERDRNVNNCTIIEDMKRQLQHYACDLNLANTMSSEQAQSSLEEEQDSRRKWQGRLTDAQTEITRLTNKLKTSEKIRSEQAAELDQTGFEVGQGRRNLVSLEKKLGNTEQLLNEHTTAELDSRDKLEAMKRRLSDYAGQISSLREERELEVRTQRELRDKAKHLQDTVDEMETAKESGDRRILELSRQLTRLQEQLETAHNTMAALVEDAEKANSRADKAHKEQLFANEQQSNVLAEKDEEIETVKKTCRGTIALLKIEVEKAEAEFSKVCMVKRELEQEVLLLQGDLDEAEATINELNSEIPRQQDILEQLNQSLGDVTARCEALQEALVRADMKCTQVTEKNEEMEDELKQVELGKRLVEQDSIDLHHKIGEQSAKQEALLDTLAKVEGQLMAQGEMLEKLEDEKGSWEKERRRMKELISTLEGDNHHLEEVRMNLESSETKLKNRMRETIFENDEALKGVKSANRARARNLESRIAELELNLEEETEIRTEHEKGLKRLERVVKELELQAMEDTQSIERQVEQITNLNNRNKQLKSQFADSEARVGSLHAKLRKLTTEVEEGETRAATMTKLLSTPTASRCSTPLRHSAMMRNSVLGSRPGSRLISPEVENILLSGRNSPVGPLASLSRGNSPAPMSPLRSNSPNSQLARGRGRVFEYPGQEDVFRRHDSITEETEGSDLIQDIKQIGSVPKVKLDPSEGEEPLKPDPSSCCEVPEVQLQRPSTVENPTEGPRISVDTLDDKPKENGA